MAASSACSYCSALSSLDHKNFDDATHIAYVNGAYRGSDALGLLMQDFFCSAPAQMHYPELARRADFFKNENKGGQSYV